MSIRKNPVAYVALFIALGGTSYAATQLPANSVGSAQLKAGAVIDKKVRAHSLTRRVFAPGTLGRSRLHIQVISRGFTAGPGGPTTSAQESATCPKGTRVVGGGWDIMPFPPPEQQSSPEVLKNEPDGKNGWTVLVANPAGVGEFKAYALCAS